MKHPEPNWNPEEWLTRCAWCTRSIQPDREVFAIKAKLSPNAAHLFPPGSIQPLTLAGSKKIVPVIFPSQNSEARRDGIQAVFQVCCQKCGVMLRKALRQELSLSGVEFAHPGSADTPSPLPNFRQARATMEKMMRQLTRLLEQQDFKTAEEVSQYLDQLLPTALDGGLPGNVQSSRLDEARDIVKDAWDQPTRKRRVAMAKQALKISPDCVEAYLLLACEASTPNQELALYEQALQAAERLLGPDAIKRYGGRFWGVEETRPYMRARASLAQCLWEQGDCDTAIDHYQALLELNPNDDQGNRFMLLDWLLAEQRDEECGKLLALYPKDNTAAWAYGRALWLFRRDGPGRGAKQALRRALKCNRFVPAFLLRLRPLPSPPPRRIGFGDESEASDYARSAMDNWQATPYALDWLEENAAALGGPSPGT